MSDYVLRVVSADDPGVDADPAVSAAVLSLADGLFTEICRNIVKGELRLQGDVPDALYRRIGIQDGGALAADARRFMDETLDYLGGDSRGTWMSDTYPDAVGRKRIAGIVLSISRSLEGAVLLHGPGDGQRAFSGVDTVWVTGMANAVTRAHPGGLIGAVVKDPARKGHYALSNGAALTPLVFLSGFSRYDVEDFLAAGLVIAVGTVIRDENDGLMELRAVENCYTLPGLVFLRAIDGTRDEGLVYPLEAVPSYYRRGGTWHLRCDDLGIEASAQSWDACVMLFHGMFLDLLGAFRSGKGVGARAAELLDRMTQAADPARCPSTCGRTRAF